MSQVAATYVPGVCNINRAEIARRRQAGYIGLTLFVVVAAVLLALSVNRWFRLVLFLPALVAVIGFLQAHNKFCVSYAASGQQNATDGNKTAERVADEAAHRKDKLKARKMNGQAVATALLITAIVVLA